MTGRRLEDHHAGPPCTGNATKAPLPVPRALRVSGFGGVDSPVFDWADRYTGLMRTLELRHGPYALELAPGLGGAIVRFSWRGEPLMRTGKGPSILDTACFPLVPFSNRIAHGRLRAGGREGRIAPNFPGTAHPHPLHGFGWLAAWRVLHAGKDVIRLGHDHAAGEWPWRYAAVQEFRLGPRGLSQTLSITNADHAPMPAGLGFHPYFPLTPAARYRGLHCGEWRTGPDGLPRDLDRRSAARDWWRGRPVGTRIVDTVYAGRAGPLELVWPERELRLTIAPTANLCCTAVYVPADGGFFCIEPVSHSTDALNRPDAQPMAWLASGETFTASVAYRADAAPLT